MRNETSSFSKRVCFCFFASTISLMKVSICHAQSSSFGPGKGPAVAGEGSKYTYPQPPKPTKYSMNSIRPAYQVPENPEKHVWKLTSKVDGRDPEKSTDDVPVYSFASGGKRVQVGVAKTGEDVSLDEIRPVGRAIYYKYPWKGAGGRSSTSDDFWVSGSNIEYAGSK
ncbi:MAG: hypothetical protein NT027_06495 [Proteobacteria bacterium]|nr:hypothetical protein [Pseudomonadota bacterium]